MSSTFSTWRSPKLIPPHLLGLSGNSWMERGARALGFWCSSVMLVLNDIPGKPFWRSAYYWGGNKTWNWILRKNSEEWDCEIPAEKVLGLPPIEMQLETGPAWVWWDAWGGKGIFGILSEWSVVLLWADVRCDCDGWRDVWELDVRVRVKGGPGEKAKQVPGWNSCSSLRIWPRIPFSRLPFLTHELTRAGSPKCSNLSDVTETRHLFSGYRIWRRHRASRNNWCAPSLGNTYNNH